MSNDFRRESFDSRAPQYRNEVFTTDGAREAASHAAVLCPAPGPAA